MTRWQVRTIHITNALVGGTGIVYAYMIYGVSPEDEFAIVNHPWQPQFQHLHILFAPLLVFAVGWIWQSHVWKRIKGHFQQHRRSGIALALLFAPMVMSGYALQVGESPLWRTICIWAHLVTSAAWIFLAVVHPLLPRRSGAGRAQTAA